MSNTPEIEYFWFPDNKNVNYTGKLISENPGETYIEISSSNPSVEVPQPAADQNTILHAEAKNIPVTYVVSLSNKKENFNLNNNTYSLVLRYRVLTEYYGSYFNKVDEIKFKNIIISFQNLEQWITYNDSVYRFNKEGNRKVIGLNENLVEFYYDSPISRIDEPFANERHKKVLYIEIKSRQKKITKDFQSTIDLLQDFFNFFVTGKNIVINSLYGVSQTDNVNRYITIVDHEILPSPNDMNKSKVITPWLRAFSEINTELESLIFNFYEFKTRASTAYDFYFEEMYQDHALEFRLFLLASFLEKYHSVFFKTKSDKNKKRSELQQLILKLENSNLSDDDKRVITDRLINCHNEPILSKRLEEIFNEYSEIIILNTPILSLISEKELEDWFLKLSPNKTHHEDIFTIIKRKKQLDLKIQDRDRYNELTDALLSEETREIAFLLLEYTRRLLIGIFPQRISHLRNIIAHSKDRNHISQNIWFHMVKSLELICQLCILTKLGFTRKQILQIYFIDRLTFNDKLQLIIVSSIFS